ncbi:hypothetical protein C8R46DRAFT_1196186 [Mycena filopes]|nr:hypothetical protein C8R46DRAFT_1196186 [Mycena filopes]
MGELLLLLLNIYGAHLLPSATLQCETEWEPSEKVFEGILHPTTEMYHNFGGVANDFIQDLAYNEPPQPASYEDSDTENDDTPTAVAINSPGGRRKSNKGRRGKSTKPKAKKIQAGAWETFSTIGLALEEPAPKPKKAARSEAQRRAHLHRDAWAKAVHPYHILCRGCKRAIKLDSRRRYYPGLWEKHRRHCVEVQAGLLQENRPIEVEVPVVVEDPMAPRKPYYREHA